MTGLRRRGSRGLLLVEATAIGYAAGTLPSAGIASRLARGEHDLRSEGSANPGAVNAAQVLGTGWGAGVLAADMAKGAVAALAGRLLAGDAGAYLAATAAIGGHVAPAWNPRGGGKGVATSAGATLVVFPVYFPVDLGVSVIGALRSRRAEPATRLACAAWTCAATAAWLRSWPNAWGPEPSVGLPLFAGTASAIILAAFARARRGAAGHPGDQR